ncbi:MAG TPA: hypothetical protein VF487_07915 [Chitinophagaceae bacterium]
MNSPNDLQNIPAVLYLKNGTIVNGNLVVNLNTSLTRPVSIQSQNNKKFKYTLNEINGFSIEGNYFNLNDIKNDFLESRERVFMKRLTPENSRIVLYEHLFNTTNNINYTDKYAHRPLYYIHFVNDKENEVWPLHGKKFTPLFSSKMSLILKDCQELSDKIQNKQEGYFFPEFTGDNRQLNVMMKIIEEYNKCQ